MFESWRTKLTLLVALATAQVAWAANTGTMTGTVTDESGKAMRGVIVSAFDLDQQKSISVLTDTNGQFILNDLSPMTYDFRARIIGFEDAYEEEVDVATGSGNDALKFVMEPTDDINLQRTGASLFGEMKWDNEEHKLSFKMSCTYCHQVGTWGFRTPEEPVDWEVMITRMDGFGALHKDLKKTLVDQLLSTYSDEAMEKWDAYTPPEPPEGKALALKVTEWDMGDKKITMIHDLEVGKDGKIYAVDMANDALVSLDPATGEREVFQVEGGKEPYSDDPYRMGPHSLECDEEGDIWITMAIGGKMGKFDVKTKEWTIVSGAEGDRPRGGYPHTLRVDGEGVVWYTDAGRGVFSLDPSNNNERKFYRLLASNRKASGRGESFGSTPYGIDVAPDGKIWYSKLNGNTIGRIDPNAEDGDIKEWEPPFRGPRRHHVAPDGMVWVPGCGSGVFAKFDPSSEEWTVYDLPNKETRFPYALNVHPQTGDVWICGTANDSMLRFIPATEELIEYPMPSRVTYTREVEFDDEGNVWVCNSNWPNRHTERRLGSIIKISLDGTVDEASVASKPAPKAVRAGAGD